MTVIIQYKWSQLWMVLTWDQDAPRWLHTPLEASHHHHGWVLSNRSPPGAGSCGGSDLWPWSALAPPHPLGCRSQSETAAHLRTNANSTIFHQETTVIDLFFIFWVNSFYKQRRACKHSSIQVRVARLKLGFIQLQACSFMGWSAHSHTAVFYH